MDLPLLLLILGSLLVIAGILIWLTSQKRLEKISPLQDPLDSLTVDELIFFEKAAELPAKYLDYLSPSRGKSFLIPAELSRVGHLQVVSEERVFNVRVGNHTDIDFHNPLDAMDFIDMILRDEIVFCFFEDRVETFIKQDFEKKPEGCVSTYLWSTKYQPE